MQRGLRRGSVSCWSLGGDFFAGLEICDATGRCYCGFRRLFLRSRGFGGGSRGIGTCAGVFLFCAVGRAIVGRDPLHEPFHQALHEHFGVIWGSRDEVRCPTRARGVGS